MKSKTIVITKFILAINKNIMDFLKVLTRNKLIRIINLAEFRQINYQVI